MEEKDIIRIWKKGSDKLNNEKPITMETIEALVKSRSGKVTGRIRWDLYFSLACYLAGLFLTSYTSALYSSHVYLKWILPAMALVLILLLIQNIQLLIYYHKLRILDVSLRDKVTRIIRYFRGGFSIWQLVWPVGMIFLVFSVTLLIDYQEGFYRINHPFEFVAVLIVMYMLMYFPMRYTRSVNLYDLENCLKNLDEQEYTSIEKITRRHRRFMIFFAIGLALLLLGSLVMWYVYAR